MPRIAISPWAVAAAGLTGLAAVLLWPERAEARDKGSGIENDEDGSSFPPADEPRGSTFVTSSTIVNPFLAAAPAPGAARERYFEANVDAPVWSDVILAPGVKIRVSSDVVKAHGVRVPLWPSTAQRVADRFDAILPTPKLSDVIWRAASTKIAPHSMQPRAGVARDSNRLLAEHEELLDRLVAITGGENPGIIAGLKKDVVVGRQAHNHPEAVTIYGWHRLDGTHVQPVFSGHNSRYADYSHGARLIHNMASVNGGWVPIETLFANPATAALVSGEGALTPAQLRYPT